MDSVFPFCPWCRSRINHDVSPDDFSCNAVNHGDLRKGTAENRLRRLSLNLLKLERELDVFLDGVPVEHSS